MKIKGLRYILAVGLAFSLCGCSVWNRVTVPNETASKEAEITESFTDSDINSPQDADNNSEQNIAAASASAAAAYATSFTKTEFLQTRCLMPQ
jgi:hypothetical protein